METSTATYLYGRAVATHAAFVLGRVRLDELAAGRLADADDDRGDVDDRTVTIALMIALAIAVMGIIATKVRGEAEAIPLGG